MRKRLASLAIAYGLAAALITPTALLAAEESAPPEAPAPAGTGTQPTTQEQPAAPRQQQAQPNEQAAPRPRAQPSQQPTAQPAQQPAAQEPEAPAEPKQDDKKEGDDKPTARAAQAGGVTIKDFNFSPASITVNVGETVTWTNSGSEVHTATANDGSFDTGNLRKGQSGSHTFSEAGTFSYICTPHPYMKGTVKVAGSSGGGGGSGGSGSSGSGSGGSGGSTGSSGSGRGLAATGADAGALAALGAIFLGLGVAVRRRAAPRP